MPTKTRSLLKNAAYHIVIRGNCRQDIFKCNKDYQRYLNKLWKYKHKYNAKIYAYCLMTNHIHLLVLPAKNENLKKLMHCLNLSYSKWFNSKYMKCGHLWQGRFKSSIVQMDQYLLNCVTYIEMNPLRVGICNRPEDYPWSSYKYRVFNNSNKILDKIIL